MRLALVTLALAFGLILAASDDPDPTTSDEPVSTTSAKPAKATKLPKLPKLPKGSPRKHTNGTKPGNGPSHKPVPTHPLCKSVLLYSQAQCCDANILGILALGCTSMKANITTSAEFDKVCAKKGKSANCCTVPVAGLDLLCVDA